MLNSNFHALADEYLSDPVKYRSSSHSISLANMYPNITTRLENQTESRSDSLHFSDADASIASTFSDWQSLNGVVRADSEPSVARNSDGRVEAFVIHGTDNSLYHKWQTSPGSTTGWSPWHSLGGVIRSDSEVTVARNSDGRLEAFVIGSGNWLYHKWQTSAGTNSWSSWISLGGNVRANSDPVVVANSDGRLEVFVIAADNSLHHKWQTSPGSTTWSPWHSLGGVIRSDSNAAVARNSDGRLEAFVIGSGNFLYHKWQTSPGSTTGWSQWISLGGNVRANSDPVVIRNSDGRLEAFVVHGPTNSLHHKRQTSPSSNSWSAWASLAGVIRSDSNAAVARNSDGRLEAFVIGSGNWLYHKWQTSPGSTTWSGWLSLGGNIKGDPAVGSNLDGRLEVFVIAMDNALWHKWQTTTNGALPIVKDPNLTVEHFVDGLIAPTSMAFMDNNNILVLEKNGNVRLVSKGQLQTQPLLQIPVNTQSERGLLGITVMGNSVFLYYTEAVGTDDFRNRVYKYSWNGQNLVNPVLLLDLPGTPGPNHDGGKLMIGPDNFLYAVIGDLNRNGKLQNFATGADPDDTSVILRISPNDGSPAPGNPLSSDPNNPLSKYYAYGIRNSFGIEFDPVNGRIWDTENGPEVFDEINSVSPGFNSGWEKVMGPISLSGMTVADLVNFPGSHYADPVLNWRQPIGITDLEFLSSSQLGSSYQNNLFVGDINNGNLYYLRLNAARTGFILSHPGLSDLIVDNGQELASITLGSGFAGITDILTGPDGLLYVLSFSDGRIYRITQSP